MTVKSVTITGATGFVGQALSKAFLAQGWRVVATRRAVRTDILPVPDLEWAQWELGQPASPSMLSTDALVHLSCDCIANSAGRGREEEEALDVRGTAQLHSEWRAPQLSNAQRPFIFASSRSASAAAENQYGRVKFFCEAALQNPGDIILRPGVIYGNGELGLYAALKRLVSKWPLVPTPSTPPSFFPTDLDELSKTIVSLASRPVSADVPQTITFGGTKGLTFPDLLRFVCEREGLRVPVMLPVPKWSLTVPVALVEPLHPRFWFLGERVRGLFSRIE